MTNKIEVVIKSLPTKKSPGPGGFTGEVPKHVEKSQCQPFPPSQTTQEERALPGAFSEAGIALVPAQ